MSFAVTDQTHKWPVTIPAATIPAAITTGLPVRFTGLHIPAAAWAVLASDGAGTLRVTSDEAGTVPVAYSAPQIDTTNSYADLYVATTSLSAIADNVYWFWAGGTATAPSAAEQATAFEDSCKLWLPPVKTGDGSVWYDLTANGNNGTLVNMDPATAWVQQDDGSWTLNFDGLNDRVLISAGIPTTGPATWLGRARRSDIDANRVLWDGGVSNVYRGLRIHYMPSSGFTGSVGSGGGTGPANRKTIERLNCAGVGWHSLGYRYTTLTDMALYVDGEDVGGTYSGTSSTYATPTANSIGFDPVSAFHHNSEIGHEALFTRNLTIAEVYAHHLYYSAPATWASAGELVAVGGGAVPMIYRAARRRSRTLIPGMVVLP